MNATHRPRHGRRRTTARTSRSAPSPDNHTAHRRSTQPDTGVRVRGGPLHPILRASAHLEPALYARFSRVLRFTDKLRIPPSRVPRRLTRYCSLRVQRWQPSLPGYVLWLTSVCDTRHVSRGCVQLATRNRGQPHESPRDTLPGDAWDINFSAWGATVGQRGD
jgi:hypothetical protein